MSCEEASVIFFEQSEQTNIYYFKKSQERATLRNKGVTQRKGMCKGNASRHPFLVRKCDTLLRL